MSSKHIMGATMVLVALLLGACGRQAPAEQRATQTVTFAALPDRYLAQSSFEAAATASSGLPVAFAASGACSVAGATVTLTAVGTCTITASQAGNDGFQPAPPVARAFEVLADVERLGFVIVSETGPSGARTVNASGTFELREEPVTDALLEDAFGGAPDTCTVTASPGAGPVPDEPAAAGTPLNAGEPLTVRAAGGAYAELVATELGRYGLGASAPTSPLPSAALTLDVPGAGFPAFSAAPFADTAPFVLGASVEPEAVTADTAFAWTAGASAGSVALLVGGDANAVFACVLADDGAFAFDDATRDALDDAGFAIGALQAAGRLTLEAHVEGDALLLLGVLRLESYGTAGTSAATDLLERAMPGVSAQAMSAASR
ncbi:MAG: hypothetical protein ABR510_05410 [Trueperaceae bacterium]